MAVLYTVKELAKLFKRDPETIYRWIAAGDVFPHAFKVKDGWYVPAQDVRRVMKRKADDEAPPGLANQPAILRSSTGRKGFVGGWK